MALSDDQILDVAATTQLYNHALPAIRFARAIEAEVRKDDEALIRQMLEALEAGLKEVIATGENEGVLFGPDQHVDEKLQEAITAARARLAPPPPTA